MFFLKNTGYKILFCALLSAAACGTPDKPLDADTRQRIDSIASAQMVQARKEVDSTCLELHTTLLPRLVDSIKQVRQQEIAEKLQSIPK